MPRPATSPVNNAQLSTQVADYLRQQILSGAIPAGTWLRQDHLAEKLGVSAIPVREAFKLLAAQGLVEHLPYRGIRVVRLSAAELEDLYAVRAFAEARAAAFAAQVIAPEELAELETLAREMERCTRPEDLPRYRELNRRFHTRIAEIAGRPYLLRLLQQLWSAYPTMLWANYPGVADASLPSREHTDSAEHAAILAALGARDPQQAARAMEQHIQRAGQALVAFVKSREGNGS
jgi:DNA-binding GntR family transcriptional regulator